MHKNYIITVEFIRLDGDQLAYLTNGRAFLTYGGDSNMKGNEGVCFSLTGKEVSATK